MRRNTHSQWKFNIFLAMLIYDPVIDMFLCSIEGISHRLSEIWSRNRDIGCCVLIEKSDRELVEYRIWKLTEETDSDGWLRSSEILRVWELTETNDWEDWLRSSAIFHQYWLRRSIGKIDWEIVQSRIWMLSERLVQDDPCIAMNHQQWRITWPSMHAAWVVVSAGQSRYDNQNMQVSSITLCRTLLVFQNACQQHHTLLDPSSISGCKSAASRTAGPLQSFNMQVSRITHC